MTHVFDPSQKHKLESDSRKKILPKEPLVDFVSSLPPEDRVTALEIGSGTGYFTVVLARYFHRVYGIEISRDMAEYTAKRLENEGIKNVGLIVGEKPPIDFEVDLAFFGNVLHEVDDPKEYLGYRAKIVVVVDWKKENSEQTAFGPPSDERVSEEKILDMLENKGYKTRKINAYHYHYFIVGKTSTIKRISNESYS